MEDLNRRYNMYFVSMGAPSLTMLLRALDNPLDTINYPDEVVYIDLGMEYDEVKQTALTIQRMCISFGIKFTLLTENILHKMLYHKQQKFTKPKDENNLQHQGWLQRGKKGYGWCGSKIKFGTQMKASLIARRLKQAQQHLNLTNPYGNSTIYSYIGLHSTEQHRIKKCFKGQIPVYPLVEQGFSKADCFNFLYNYLINNPNVKLPVLDLYKKGLTHIGCLCCRNHNIKEITNIRENLPDVFTRLLEIEELVQEPYYRSPRGWAKLSNVYWNNTRYEKERKND